MLNFLGECNPDYVIFIRNIFVQCKRGNKEKPELCKTQTSEINGDRDVYIDTMMGLGVLVLYCKMLLSLLEYMYLLLKIKNLLYYMSTL